MKNIFLKSALCAALATAFVGCNDNADSSGNTLSKPISLTIAHVNDHHSHLDEIAGKYNRIGFKQGDKEYSFDYASFPKVVSKIKEITAANKNVLKLHSGDAITGDLYFTLFEGKADAQMMNTVCFDAFALGNHEFDSGDAGLAKFLDFLGEGDCGTPVLAANVVPHKDSALLKKDYLKPYTIKEVDGEKIGIIGIDIAKKTKQSSSPDEGTMFLDEAETAQKNIDELKKMGVNKIILMTHYQYGNDKKLAAKLDGVDVIVGGDSHTLLGNNFKKAGISVDVEGDYPTVVKDKSGNQVCIVQAWEYSKVVGELNVDFDENGVVSKCDGTPHLLLSDKIQGDEVTKQDAEAKAFVAKFAELSFVTPDATAQKLLDGYNVKVDEFNKNIIADVSENLCLERQPGQGKSSLAGCGKDATINHGGDIQQIVAQAFRTTVKNLDGKTPDIAIQNAGGVREDIPKGQLSLGKAYKVLPFDNTMVILTMTGAEIKQLLEGLVPEKLGTENDDISGAYPYAAGLRWDIDLNNAKNERFSNIQVKRSGSNAWETLSDAETYTVVTNSFAANGGDGYDAFKTASDAGKAFDTKTRYVQPLLDYVDLKGGKLEKLPVSEYSTQKYTPKVAAQ